MERIRPNPISHFYPHSLPQSLSPCSKCHNVELRSQISGKDMLLFSVSLFFFFFKGSKHKNEIEFSYVANLLTVVMVAVEMFVFKY